MFEHAIYVLASLWASALALGQVLFTPALRKNIIAQDIDNVKHAAGFDGADFGEKVYNALLALPASGGVVDARGLIGAQVMNTTITIPVGVSLLLGNVTLTSGSSPAFNIELDIYGSGHIRGIGIESVISYTGSGEAIDIAGAGAAAAAMVLEDFAIQGTSSGDAGIHLQAFNGGTIRNVQVSGFTAAGAAGNFDEGANTITIVNPIIRDNVHGIHNVGKVVSAVNYAANTMTIHGGEIIANTGWGGWEDGALSATVGANTGNKYFGVTFQDNGANGSSTSGNFFFQMAYGCSLIGCYFEYAAVTPLNNIVIGDGTFTPSGCQIIGNVFLSAGATSTISHVRSTLFLIEGNQESAAVTNFVNNATDGRLSRVLWNSAVAATNYFAGSDTGVDSLVFPAPTDTTILNGFNTSSDGIAFNTISGLSSTAGLQIRNNGLAANAFTVQDSSGNSVGGWTNTQLITLSGVGIQIGGDLQFNVGKGQHIETQAANNDICGSSTLSTGTRTITFTTAFSSNPIVVACSQTANHVFVSSVSTTSFTVTGTGSDPFNYIIIGNPN